jgi:flagellar biosynthetic protein FlhB
MGTYERIKINLQMFASKDGKTEKATQKKRQDARKKGQVLQSREISSAVMLIILFICLRLFGKGIYLEITSYTKTMLAEYSKMDNFFTISTLSKFFSGVALVLLKTTAPILIIAFTTGFITGYAQVGFLFTMETLSIKFSRINPISGLKRLFSLRAVVELIKSIFKIGIIGYIAYSYIKGEERNIINTANMDIMDTAIYLGLTIINVAIRICILLIILAVLDYLYQWWEYEKSIKMSKQEVKEEYKQLEGNPEIKSKIKQKQRQISMRRMMQEVPKADVIITNPTHYAVAIKYDASVADAPKIIAKGQDFIALRIKEIAKEAGVEIVENKTLARTIYQTVEIGNTIPQELFQAVAEVLAFVYNLKGKRQLS